MTARTPIVVDAAAASLWSLLAGMLATSGRVGECVAAAAMACAHVALAGIAGGRGRA